jgi:LytS/YehU family sensor histidine kinase
MVLYSALLQVKPGEAIQWHFDAPVWMAIQCFIAQWITVRWYDYFQGRQQKKATITAYVRVFLCSNGCFTLAVSALILGLEFVIGIQTITMGHIITLISMQFILHTIVGGFTLAFKVFEHIKQQQIALEQTERALLESQVKTLQQHIDPHFLFNNLNILSALIQQDPDDADEYLNTFCDIYRYILQHKDHTLVPLKDELTFAKNYMELISTRFDNAYTLEVTTLGNVDLSIEVLPCSLQLAIENVIKHNQGNKAEPLIIKLHIEENQLRISNKIHKKQFKQESNGLGIANLQARCKTIFNQALTVTHTANYFELVLPMSKSKASA